MIFLILLACTGEKDSSAVLPQTGTLSLNFSMSNGVRENTNLHDPLKGAIYGSVFRAEDITVTGPLDGTESVADVEVYDVDLTVDTVSSATWKSADLEPRDYSFLGFFDVDANGDASREPEAGDPVTLPSINVFAVVANQETPFTVSFDLVYN